MTTSRYHVMCLRLSYTLVPAFLHLRDLDPSPFRRALARPSNVIQRRLLPQTVFLARQRLRQISRSSARLSPAHEIIASNAPLRYSVFVVIDTPEVQEIKDVKEFKEIPNSRALG